MPKRICNSDGCTERHYARGWCRLHYWRWYRRQRFRWSSTAERWWAYVDQSAGPDGCWPWTGTRGDIGHGQFTIGTGPGSRWLAHRWGYQTLVGPLPDGLFVMHACDNPPCCNPAHLSLGTPADNSADMVAKGRQSRGEAQPGSKLTDAAVRDIRARYVPLVVTLQQLGDEYGVDKQTVYNVIHRNTWAHVL